MEKKQLYIIGAVVLVLLFLIEPFAIGLMSNSQKGAAQPAKQKGSLSLTGTVFTNITIAKYQPYIIVKGRGEAVEKAKQRLLESGNATYAASSGDSLIISLRDSRLAPAAAAEFEGANATVLATALIITPPTIRVEGRGISTEAEGTSFNLQINPIFEEGSRVGATFTAAVEGGEVVGIGNFYPLPELLRGIEVEAELLPSQPESYEIEVRWEDRAKARELASSLGASYREKSYILTSPNASQQQLEAMKAKEYVTGVRPGLISVRNNFTNSTKAGQDLSSAGLEYELPPSVATLPNGSSKQDYESALARLEEAGINAWLSAKSTLAAKLPPFIEAGGKRYKAQGIGIETEKTAPLPSNATSVRLILDFEAVGNRVARITDVKQA
ncbi:MAG: hypothetical protein N3E51_04035 [Candidatus Micrarchaeota archaeon]|nr:hypothetical protein [Candidatus Micrarchaeota archaeon]